MFDIKNLTPTQTAIVASMSVPGLIEKARALALAMSDGMLRSVGSTAPPTMAIAMAAVSVACIAVEQVGIREDWDADRTYRMIVDLVVAMIHVKQGGAEIRARESVATDLASIFKKEVPRG